MKGRIIFFPMLFCPEIDEIHHLKELQERINDYHAGMVLAQLQLNLSPFQMVIRRQAMVNTMRESWKVVEGGKVPITLDEKLNRKKSN